ncbi:hypothetical protein PMAYCL1PPCAC_15966, partial [Pristionchus mayeri]
QMLSIQAVLPVFFVICVIDYLSCQYDFVPCSPLQEHFMIEAASLMPLIAPAITLYYVQPYRMFLQKLLCRKNQNKTAIHS